MYSEHVQIDNLPLQFNVGESLVAEFARSHSPTDVLRELVQNEYDAGGSELSVVFGGDRLVVTGNGNPIDSAGWNRLSVMLGTGRIPNTENHVEPKESSIGSKNFGIRSLFTVGDTIRVISAGMWSLLHWQRGALIPPREADDSPESGIRIEVPYRKAGTHALEPFDSKKRAAWLKDIDNSLTETLIKLAKPGRSKSLRRVRLSATGNPEITWEQEAKEEQSPARAIRVLRRRAVQRSDGRRDTTVELEFQAKVKIPKAHVHKDFPSYYRHSRNQLWIGVSLRLTRGRPDTNSIGLAFYPLGAPSARTGNLVSLNAPFELDNNRANVVSPNASSWNQWLIDELVELTVRLLKEDWYERFGADAYLALEDRGHDPSNQLAKAYAETIIARLTTDNLWATRKRSRGKFEFVAAADLVLPDKPEFNDVLDPDNILGVDLASSERVVKMASESGASRFGTDSLVRLRCAGEDATNIRTRPRDQSNRHFVDFDHKIRQLSLQKKFAAALDKARLSANHRADLQDTATTQAADRSLHAVKYLIVVPSDEWKSSPVPLSQRLHPGLAEHSSVRRLAKKYDMVGWIRETAKKAKERKAPDDELEALMRTVLARSGKFDARTSNLLRGSPVLLDQRGHWVEPRKITLKTVDGSRSLSSVLSFPHASYGKDSVLAERLKFRKAIDGGDLVNLAVWIARNPEKAVEFERTLARHSRLLKPAQWRKIRSIQCLESSEGNLSAPETLYIVNDQLLSVFGDEVNYVRGQNHALYRRMGCKSLPNSSDIFAAIERNRERESPSGEVLYVSLVEALKRERQAFKQYADKDIIWTASGYSAPSSTLIITDGSRLFQDAVPLVRPRSKNAVDAFRRLGCRQRPGQEDWAQLIVSISESVGSQNAVPIRDQQRLVAAYSMLRDGIPVGAVSPVKPYILGRDTRLFDPQDLLVDDFPKLAKRLEVDDVPFAWDFEQSALSFYYSSGVRRLTDAVTLKNTRLGDQQEEPARLGAAKIRRQLDSIAFRSAFAELIKREIADHRSLDMGFSQTGQFPDIQTLAFVDELSREYKLDDNQVSVPAKYLFADATLHVVVPESRAQLRSTVSFALAEAAIGSPKGAQMLVSVIYRLLDCGSTEDIADFMEQRGIPWKKIEKREIWDNEPDWGTESGQFDGETVAGQIAGHIASNLDRRAGVTGSGNTDSRRDFNIATPKAKNRTLPPIDTVVARVSRRSGSLIVAGSGGGGGAGITGGSWSPRNPEWDREIGRRGEEIAYRYEIERVREMGHDSPSSFVTWVADEDPTADHDIRSITEDGSQLWIEVKSTSGSDGRFEWPVSEIAKAMAEREHYVLYRVYRADSTSPILKRFPNPLSMIDSRQMRLGLGTIRAQVESAP